MLTIIFCLCYSLIVLRDSTNNTVFFEKELITMNTYEINLNTITNELVETYNRLLNNDVCIADAYRDEATENFEGTVGLLVLTGRIEDNEEAFEYIETLKARFSNCRKCFEESYKSEHSKNMPCDYSGICAGMSCPMYWKCQH